MGTGAEIGVALAISAAVSAASGYVSYEQARQQNEAMKKRSERIDKKIIALIYSGIEIKYSVRFRYPLTCSLRWHNYFF